MKKASRFVPASVAVYCASITLAAGQYLSLRVHPSNVPQTEPVITVHPTNSQMMAVGSRTVSGAWGSEGVYVTTNGGLSWFGNDTCSGQSTDNHGGDPGLSLQPTGSLVLTHIGSIFRGMYSHITTDFGNSWTDAYTIFYNDVQPVDDKGQTTAVDNNPTSPHYGRIYAAWAIIGSPFTVLSSYTSNGGQTWSTPATVNPSPPAHCSGTYTCIGLNGKVYIAWVGLAPSSSIEDFVGFAVSTDGGVTWRVTQNAFDMNGIFGTLPSKNGIRVNGLPQVDIDRSGGARNGWIYIATGEKNLLPAGSDPDIILHRSTDDGITWSTGIRVNHDALNNGKIQYFPAVDVDHEGGLNIIYYDDRNTAADSAEVMLTRSTDGGDTWIERVISDHRFKPKRLFPSGYQGDHIAITSVGGKLWPFWMDDFSGVYQIWTCPIDISTLDFSEEDEAVPSTFELKQNYPNPFNPGTKLGFWIKDYGLVTLKVYDVLGREVATLVNEVKRPGMYAVTWDATGMANGVYLYRLSTSGRSSRASSDVKKCLLLR